MAATNTGARAAILREVEAELNRTDENASSPPSTWDYASDVARRMLHIANEIANPVHVAHEGVDYLSIVPEASDGVVCTRHDRRAFTDDHGVLRHLMDGSECVTDG